MRANLFNKPEKIILLTKQWIKMKKLAPFDCIVYVLSSFKLFPDKLY